eukprot:SAG11_NODE_396_length_9806_cov_37.601855_10_plen_199_part_00
MDLDAKWAEKEERLNAWDHDITPEETCFFSMRRVTVSPKDSVAIEIEVTDYHDDERLSELYKFLESFDEKRLPNSKYKTTAENKHLFQKFMVAQHYIDTNGLLYNVNEDGIERLCIPNKTLENGETLYFTIYRECHDISVYRHRGYRRNCDPRRSTAPIMYVTPDPGSTNTSVLLDLVPRWTFRPPVDTRRFSPELLL